MLSAAETAKQIVSDYAPKSEREAADRRQILGYLSKGNDALTRDDAVAHFTASAWVTDPSREYILMAYHNIYRSWAWLGGHAYGDPDLCSVASREAREETGITNLKLLCDGPISLEVLNVSEHVKHGEIVSPHLHFNLTYLFETEKESSLKVKADENSAVGWRTLAQIREETDEAQIIPIYKKLIAIMKQF